MLHVLAENGKSRYYIVTHRYADRAVRHAASELQKYLLRSTLAELPYFSDRCEKRGPEIRIGENVRGKTNDLSRIEKEEGYLITEDGEDIVITGRGSRGVLYGVYRFLEIYCGFRCFIKGVEKIDRIDRLQIEDVDLCESPAFSYREAYFRSAFDGEYCVKNRLNGNMADISEEQGGHIRWFNFHHAWRDLVPKSRWFDSHPEYFALNGKVRNGDDHAGQLCTTNPDVVRVAGDQLEKWIE
ncbi:MAG: hypothetical protein MJ072_01660, partial [Clostridia bacterium]|nr:hypothetical protein [Clostridia bacterium]